MIAPLKTLLIISLALIFSSISTLKVEADISKWTEKAHKSFSAKQRYPRKAINAGIEGTVLVSVRVDKAGSITGFDIVESSKHDILDNQVLTLLSRVDPLPALPEGYDKRQFVIPLTYKLAQKAELDATVEVQDPAEMMKKWGRSVTRILARKQTYPSHLLDSGVEGIVKVKVKVDRSGTIMAQEVVHSSGNEQLDKEALNLMALINPLPSLPEGRDSFSVTLPLKYKISK